MYILERILWSLFKILKQKTHRTVLLSESPIFAAQNSCLDMETADAI